MGKLPHECTVVVDNPLNAIDVEFTLIKHFAA